MHYVLTLNLGDQVGVEGRGIRIIEIQRFH